MKNKLLKDLENVFENLTNLRNLALNLDENLLSFMLEKSQFKDEFKSRFFVKLKNSLVFKQQDFLFFLNLRALNHSFTEFSTKIGLSDKDRNFFMQNSDVVLNFPFKDCVLKGNKDKDDKEKSKEIFFNEILAKDEIDILFSPKVFYNFELIESSSENNASKEYKIANAIKQDSNLLIKGNNLIVLHSLLPLYANKVKLIYIDPPYNTGNDSFNYNDKFNHSSWLCFMKNRLEVAREFLRDDGVIFVQCDDNEQAYLKVLMDEIFGRENFVNTICWQKKNSPQNDAKWLSDNHDFILIYAKRKETWKPNLLPRTEEMNARYKNPDNDPRGVWMAGDLSVKTYSVNYDYPITTPSGKIVYPPTSRSWRTSKENLEKLIQDNRIWFGKNGDNTPTIKRFLTEVKDGLTPLTLWTSAEAGTNLAGKNEIKALFAPSLRGSEATEAIHSENTNENSNRLPRNADSISRNDKNNAELFSTPKPEALLKRIIEISTQENDLVMDFFAGSGTTCAVAHKMKRRWIGIEQMDYIESITKERLIKVINGEQGGISKALNWQGGGNFVYAELMPFNVVYKEKIANIENESELESIYKDLESKAFLDYRIDFKDFLEKAQSKEFKDLSLENKKKLLFLMLDTNMDYVPLGDINDSAYDIKSSIKEFNKIFYKK